MVDKAYPEWAPKQRLEMARNQFVQGLESASVQLLLMRERPETLDVALDLAQQQLSVESAQKRLHRQALQSRKSQSSRMHDGNTFPMEPSSKLLLSVIKNCGIHSLFQFGGPPRANPHFHIEE